VNANIAADLQPLAHPIADLVELPGNPRRGDVDAVARSYETFGQRKPVVVRSDEDGRLVVIAGNHQLAAARQLGWTHIAVASADDLSDDAARAFALADNRTAELGGYDDQALLDLLTQVDDDALLDATGWERHHIDDLVLRLQPPSLDDLDDQYGEHDDTELWPVVKVKVSPAVFEKWGAWVATQHDEGTALEALLAMAIHDDEDAS
jgi:hypothetical protein